MRLRYLLFVVIAGVTLIPVAFFGIWPHSRALENELADVSERHLLIAQNLGQALERYDRDVKAAFKLLAMNAIADRDIPGTVALLDNLNFRHICIADPSDGAIRHVVAAPGKPCPKVIPEGRFGVFKMILSDGPPRFTRVLPGPQGAPTIYLVARLNGLLAVGAISTDYFVKLGTAISFGKRGHAAIVDHTGRILAHPLPDWRTAMKNISGVAPVKSMLAGKTGVTTFWSPALKGDMVAGYTAVAGPGWGVMIPQPIAELEERADAVRLYALGVIILGVLAAGAVSWVISGMLTRPVRAVSEAARRMADGDTATRVEPLASYSPREFADLADAFNTLAGAIDQAKEAQSQALQREKVANRTKSDFLANISHELRTPLNAIIGFSTAIKSRIFGSDDTDRYAEYGGDIYDSATHLLALIDDLLDMAKIEAGTLVPEDQWLDPVDLVEKSCVLVRYMADDRGVTLTCVPPDVPVRLRADERMVVQILVNLLSNAVKFTPGGGTVNVGGVVGDDGEFLLTVRDTGAGIPEDVIATVFEPFSQARRPMTRNNEGAGLGLAIVRDLVEKHGGGVDLQSQENEGTTVTVRFPAERVSTSVDDPGMAGDV